jgi:FAD/FMN-containing dehydrogenase
LDASRVGAGGGVTIVTLESEGDGRTLVEYASERGLRLRPFYGEEPGGSEKEDVYVTTGDGLSGDITVVAEDMYVEAPAPFAFAGVKEAVAKEASGLWLPFLPGDEEVTAGELLAGYPPNPLAPIYGELPRMVLGVEGLLGTGDFIKSGRRTVKGVVGYDLTGLFVGSRDRLGLIARVRFRLWARPPARAVWATDERLDAGWGETLEKKRASPFNLDGRPAVYAEGRPERLAALIEEILGATGGDWEEVATGSDALDLLGGHFERPGAVPVEETDTGSVLGELGGPFYSAVDGMDGGS